ncbi:MAG: hypothetical protein QM768_22595 [Agriterribacter sp.]
MITSVVSSAYSGTLWYFKQVHRQKKHIIAAMNRIAQKLNDKWFRFIGVSVIGLMGHEFGMPVSFYRYQLNKILDSLKQTKAIIVDIRNHGAEMMR